MAVWFASVPQAVKWPAPASRVDAEGFEKQVDGVLLEGGGRRMLPPDRHVRAAPVGLVHGGERGGVRVDAEIAHVERAADIGCRRGRRGGGRPA